MIVLEDRCTSMNTLTHRNPMPTAVTSRSFAAKLFLTMRRMPPPRASALYVPGTLRFMVYPLTFRHTPQAPALEVNPSRCPGHAPISYRMPLPPSAVQILGTPDGKPASAFLSRQKIFPRSRTLDVSD